MSSYSNHICPSCSSWYCCHTTLKAFQNFVDKFPIRSSRTSTMYSRKQELPDFPSINELAVSHDAITDVQCEMSEIINDMGHDKLFLMDMSPLPVEFEDENGRDIKNNSNEKDKSAMNSSDQVYQTLTTFKQPSPVFVTRRIQEDYNNSSLICLQNKTSSLENRYSSVSENIIEENPDKSYQFQFNDFTDDWYSLKDDLKIQEIKVADDLRASMDTSWLKGESFGGNVQDGNEVIGMNLNDIFEAQTFTYGADTKAKPGMILDLDDNTTALSQNTDTYSTGFNLIRFDGEMQLNSGVKTESGHPDDRDYDNFIAYQQDDVEMENRNLTSKIRNDHNLKPRTHCLRCTDPIRSKNVLSLNFKENPGDLFCDKCKTTYHHSTDTRVDSTSVLQTDTKDSNSRKYKCDQCTKRFKNEGWYKYHLQCHVRKNSKLFECMTCGQQFGALQNLKNHQVKHMTNADFECDICRKKFRKPYHLKFHYSTHFKSADFMCPSCGKHICCFT